MTWSPTVSPMEIELQAPARLPAWDPGVRGGIPETRNRLTLSASYLRRHGSFTAALNAAILAVPTPGAVLIPGRAEPYALTGPVRLRSGVVVKGEGPTRTVIQAHIARSGDGIDGSGFHPVFRFQGEWVAAMQATRPVLAGDRRIELEPHIFGAHPEPGQLLVLTMENDPAHGWDRYDWERRVRGQPFLAAAVAGSTVTLDAPVRLDYPLAFYPEVSLVRAIQGAGLEDLRIVNDPATEANWTVAFWYAVNCWLRNCEIEQVPDVAAWVWNSRWVTLEGCHVHGARSLDGGKGYGVNVCGHSADCLVTDNIFEGLRHSMLTHFGANGNVFAYNLSRAPAMSDLSLHGWYGYMNLFEGNVAAQGYADNAWGRSGPHNTFFRNRLQGYDARYEAEAGVDYTGYEDHRVEGLQVDPDSDHQNLLGNTLADARLILRGCAQTWVEKNLVAGAEPGGPLIDADGDTAGTVDLDNHGPPAALPLASAPATPAVFRPSLYLDAPPAFWATDVKPWPVTGGDLDRGGSAAWLSLPAEDRHGRLPWRPGWGPRVPRLEMVGAANGWPGDTLTLRAKGFHMDAAIRLRYVVDWGDGEVTASALVRSGAALEIPRVWKRVGTFLVRCQARDQYGLTSRWSQSLTVTIESPEGPG